jgi:hypothetical protein
VAANVLEILAATAGVVDRDDLTAISARGFVSAEKRPSGLLTYKLRWRRNGRQCVRYLGSDPTIGARVKAAVAALRQPMQTARELNTDFAATRRALREVKAILSPLLAANGLAFHSYTVRRKATPPVD